MLADAEWHKTAEIASKLGLKGTRAREIMRELCVIDKVVDNGKTKGKMWVKVVNWVKVERNGLECVTWIYLTCNIKRVTIQIY